MALVSSGSFRGTLLPQLHSRHPQPMTVSDPQHVGHATLPEHAYGLPNVPASNLPLVWA